MVNIKQLSYSKALKKEQCGRIYEHKIQYYNSQGVDIYKGDYLGFTLHYAKNYICHLDKLQVL